MTSLLSQEERDQLLPAETYGSAFPIPTQNVSSDEYFPRPQSATQRALEARLGALGDELAAKQGLSRRRFFQTASGMAASFLVMNEIYGPLFSVEAAEAAEPERAQARADALKGQFILDSHTHFMHPTLAQPIFNVFLGIRNFTRKVGWNPEIPQRVAVNADLGYENYIKEMFLDSDTKAAIISSAPSDIKADWFLSNADMLEARRKTNAAAGSRRLLAHAIITPGQPGWLEAIDKSIEVDHPDSWKGYTIGDNTHPESSHYPWRLDDERLMYPAYEKFAKSGIKNVCIHKGLFPPSAEKRFPNLRNYVDVSDVGRAAKDWPQLNFIVYHSGYRHAGGGDPQFAAEEFMRTGRINWVSDLAEIPGRWGVTNVYGDVGQSFAETVVAQPMLAAALMSTLVTGLGPDRVVWGTDALWTGSPQWQIEGLRRLEVPAEMQRKLKLKPLGAADGPVKTAIFGGNAARLYDYQQHAELAQPDALALLKAEYEKAGAEPSNRRYGYIRKPA